MYNSRLGRHILNATSILALTCTPAFASDINPEGAAHLKAMFQKLLDKQTDFATTSEGSIVEYKGEILVEPSDSYYNITLPKTIVSTKNNDAEPLDVHIGMVTINAMPGNKPKEWKMSVATPTPILGYDADNKENFRLSIGKQAAAGIWHEDFENFVQLKANYENIRLGIAEIPSFLTVSKIAADYDLKEDEQNRWSGPTSITISDAEFSPKSSRGFLKVGDMTIKSTADRLSQKTVKEIENIFRAATTENENPQPLDINKIIPLALNVSNGLTFEMNLTDFHFRNSDGDEMSQILNMDTQGDKEGKEKENQLQSASVGKLNMGIAIRGIMENNLQAKLAFGFDNLETTPKTQDENKNELIPTYAKFVLDKKNIPIRDIVQTLQNATQNGQSFNPVILMVKLPALLSNAKTRIDLQSTFGTAEWRIDNEGFAQANLNAANSATAIMKTQIRNIDKMIEYAKFYSNDTDKEKAQKYNNMLNALQKLKAIGIASSDKEENTTYTFNLVMNETGSILLNDQPALPLLGQLGPVMWPF